MNRKGSLAISTNAIVVLIVAIVMLGLILGLVTNIFGGISNQITQQLESEPDPQTSSGVPVQVSTARKIVEDGGVWVVKVGVFNNGDDPYDSEPTFTCSDDARAGASAPQALTIQPDNQGIYVISGQAEGVGFTTCSFNAPGIGGAQFSLEVVEG